MTYQERSFEIKRSIQNSRHAYKHFKWGCIFYDSILISLPFSLGGKVELQWQIAPRELSGGEDTEEVRLSDFCCETLRLGGCKKGTEDGPATDAPPDTDDTRRKVQKVRP